MYRLSLKLTITTIIIVAMLSVAYGEIQTDELYQSYVVEQYQSISWQNTDAIPHTITSGTPRDGPTNLFDSSLLKPQETFTYKFTNAGIFDYFCMIHPWETGTINVTFAPDPSPIETFTQPTEIPAWVKIIFQGWINGDLTDEEMKNAIVFLINNGIIVL